MEKEKAEAVMGTAAGLLLEEGEYGDSDIAQSDAMDDFISSSHVEL